MSDENVYLQENRLLGPKLGGLDFQFSGNTNLIFAQCVTDGNNKQIVPYLLIWHKIDGIGNSFISSYLCGHTGHLHLTPNCRGGKKPHCPTQGPHVQKKIVGWNRKTQNISWNLTHNHIIIRLIRRFFDALCVSERCGISCATDECSAVKIRRLFTSKSVAIPCASPQTNHFRFRRVSLSTHYLVLRLRSH